MFNESINSFKSNYETRVHSLTIIIRQVRALRQVALDHWRLIDTGGKMGIIVARLVLKNETLILFVLPWITALPYSILVPNYNWKVYVNQKIDWNLFYYAEIILNGLLALFSRFYGHILTTRWGDKINTRIIDHPSDWLGQISSTNVNENSALRLHRNAWNL